MSTTARLVRRRVVFGGRVQGVFFRATAQRISARFDVVGYVQNLPDGRVRLEAQGGNEDISAFLEAICAHFGANISDEREETIPTRDDEKTFVIC